MSDAVLVERRDRVLLITLNRPEAMNAINADLSAGLHAAVRELDADDRLLAGVLTGAGRGFCSGMDLKAFAEGSGLSPLAPPEGFLSFVHDGAQKPLIAAVEGFALAGGLELALSCDLIVAARGARFGLPEVNVGLFAAAGALVRLPSRLPFAVATELLLTGDPITAEDAHHHGLVARLTDPGEASGEALRLADRIARNAPLAVAATKALLRRGQGITEAEFWDVQVPYSEKVFLSEDAWSGPRAFAEKRTPVWAGR